MTNRIRRLMPSDHDAAIEIYREAVLNSSGALYTPAQQSAWASQAEQLRPMLQRGRGWLCERLERPHSEESGSAQGTIEAFTLREPEDRVSLLYCRPRAQRRGLARQLLQTVETEARSEGCCGLRTEASWLSVRLFQAEGWQISWQEELRIAGVHFHRYRLHKRLEQHHS